MIRVVGVGSRRWSPPEVDSSGIILRLVPSAKIKTVLNECNAQARATAVFRRVGGMQKECEKESDVLEGN